MALPEATTVNVRKAIYYRSYLQTTGQSKTGCGWSYTLKTTTCGKNRRINPYLLVWAFVGFADLSATAEESQMPQNCRNAGTTITLTPKGETLLVGFMGQLWWWSLDNGKAELSNRLQISGCDPQFSPDGKQIVFQRYLSDQWDIWKLDVENGTQRALTTAPYNDLEPTYTLDGSIVFVSDRTGNFDVWSLNPISNDLSLLISQTGNASFPSVSDRGDLAYVSQDGDTWIVKVLSTQGRLVDAYTSRHPLGAPSWRPGGGAILFSETTKPQKSSLKLLIFADKPAQKDIEIPSSVAGPRIAWISSAEFLYTANGSIWRRGLTNTESSPVILQVNGQVKIRAPFQNNGL